MPISLIDINDCDLRILQNTELKYHGPGIAQLDSETKFDRDALAQFKLSPLSIDTHYWQKLDQQAATALNNPAGHSHAELAYRHLQFALATTGELGSVLFSVPSYYRAEQLSLLLGIANSCRIETRAIVNKAIFAVPDGIDSSHCLYLELGLHQATLSEVALAERLRLVRSETLPQLGLLNLIQELSNRLAEVFLKHSRFNPLHSGASEQQLFEQLLNLVQGHSKQQELNIDNNHLPISDTLLLQSSKHIVNQLLKKISEKPKLPLIIDDRCLWIPGLITTLQEQSRQVLISSEKKQIQLWQTHASKWLGDCKDAHYITERAYSIDSQTDQIPTSKSASHLLINNTAHQVHKSSLYITLNSSGELQLSKHSDQAIASLHPCQTGIQIDPHQIILVNGKPIHKSALLNTGDKISTTSSRNEIRAIEVV